MGWIAVTLIVLIVATKLLEHTDFVQLDKRGRSGTRKDLRNWLIQRFCRLGHRSSSDPKVDVGHLFNCLYNHVEETTNKGWYSIFRMVEGCAGLIFILCVSIWLGNWLAWIPITLCITSSVLVVKYSEAKNLELAVVRRGEEQSWIDLSVEIIRQQKLISGYGQADKVTGEFKKTYEKFYNAHRAHRKFELTTNWRCTWATHLFYYGFIGAGPLMVYHANLSLSQYVGLVKLFSSINKYVQLMMKSIANMEYVDYTLIIHALIITPRLRLEYQSS